MNIAIQSVLDRGARGAIIDVECHMSNGLPSIIIVGLGNKAVDEAKERVRSAFASSKLSMPTKRIVINLAPADLPKESTSLDLAIALAILSTSGQVTYPIGNDCAIIGELGLDGSLRAVRGIIGKVIAGKNLGIHKFFIPVANFEQAALIPGVEIFPFASLAELCTKLSQPGKSLEAAAPIPVQVQVTKVPSGAMSEVSGQARAKRAMEIAAAGGHNIFLSGPPGTGKSMLAKALPSILPELSRAEMLEVTHLHSLTDSNFERLITTRPFRSPHHSSSAVSIIGGGHTLRPGEISLSHHGILFLDEMPEFPRSIIEALRQPLEDHQITVARARDVATFPASFILVATANPCPCGYFGTSKTCQCPAHLIAKYRQKISGPIMDRIDLYVDVEEVLHDKLLAQTNSDDNEIKERVAQARKLQQTRFTGTTLNGSMSNKEVKAHAHVQPDALELLNKASKRLGISARSYMHIVKVARTIADLDESTEITLAHISEALQYRAPAQPINEVS